MSLPQNFARAALVVTHPSHELRVHGWLEQTRPYVCILTDGGGRSGDPRLPRTTEVLSRVGATPGSIYGRLTDLEVYSAILNENSELFVELVKELALSFAQEQIDFVVGDAAEGYSAAHDICRMVIGAAVDLAERVHGHRVANFDFLVVGPPDECPEELFDESIWLNLDDAAFARKVNARHWPTLPSSPRTSRQRSAALRFKGFDGFRSPR
jgi:hypothetical protein